MDKPSRTSRLRLEKEHDAYYLEVMRDYEKRGIDWQQTADYKQILGTLSRAVYTTTIKIEAKDGKE